jgi:hypothetical protein
MMTTMMLVWSDGFIVDIDEIQAHGRMSIGVTVYIDSFLILQRHWCDGHLETEIERILYCCGALMLDLSVCED